MEGEGKVTIFDSLIWIGSAVTLAGIIAILWCVIKVLSARKANLDDVELRRRLAKVLPVNMAALALSVIGLVTVVIGVALG